MSNGANSQVWAHDESASWMGDARSTSGIGGCDRRTGHAALEVSVSCSMLDLTRAVRHCHVEGSPMRKGSLRRGMIGGVVISVFSAATLASRSADPLPTFAYVLAFALLCVALALFLVVAVNRSPKPPIRS